MTLTTVNAADIIANGVPRVTSQPESLAVTAGTGVAATFAAAAVGWDVTVQWYKSTDSGAHWAAVGGEVATTYVVPCTDTTNDGLWVRAVFSAVRRSVTTDVATLAVSGT